jgi:hypothetical protein
MTFDFEGARKAGASDDQIIEHLSSHPDYSGFDFASAKKAGAPSKEMIEYLKTEYKPKQESKKEPPKPSYAGVGKAEAFGHSALEAMSNAAAGAYQYAQEKFPSLEKHLPEALTKTNIAKHKKEQAQLEEDPRLGFSAKAGSITGSILEPVGLALPIGKANTVAKLVKGSAITGGALGFIGATGEGEDRTTNAFWGTVGGGVGGAAIGTAGKYLGKALGKDWFNGNKELSKDVIDHLHKTEGAEVADAAKAMQSPIARAHTLNPTLVEDQQKALDKFHEKHDKKHGWGVDDYVANPEEHSWKDALNFEANKFANRNIPKGLDKEQKEAFQRHLKDDFKAKAEENVKPKSPEEIAAKEEAFQKAQIATTALERQQQIEKAQLDNARSARVATRAVQADERRTPSSMERAHTEALAEDKDLAAAAVELEDKRTAAMEMGSSTSGVKKKSGKGTIPGVSSKDLGGAVSKQASKSAGGAAVGGSAGAMADEGDSSDSSGLGIAQGAILGAAGVYGASKLAQHVGTRFFDKAKASSAAEIGVDILKKLDHVGGVIATGLHNIHPSLGFKFMQLEGKMSTDIHNGIAKADPFFEAVHQLGGKSKEAIKVAWLNGNRAGLKAAFAEHPEALKSLEDTFKHIDDTGKDLEKKGIVGGLLDNYLPRSVKDREGLLKSLDFTHRKTLEEKLEKASRKVPGGTLSSSEEAAVINEFLSGKGATVFSPSYAKGRKIESVSKETSQFYHDPIETYHSYVNNTTQEKHLHEMFGKDSKVKDGKFDMEGSIGQHVNGLLKKGEIDLGQADDLRNLLDARFRAGKALAGAATQVYTQASTLLALGNIVSSAKNLGDPITAGFRYGTVPALKSTLMALAGKSELSPKDFGLIDHISADFINTTPTARIVSTVMNASGWKLLDSFGKSVQFGAQLNRAKSLVKTEEGFGELKDLYSKALGERFPQYVKDLHNGELSPLVKEVALWEVAQHQPLTKLQKSEFQLRNPNIAAFTHQFKSYMMMQANWARIDGYNKIKEGMIEKNDRKVAQGLTNIAKIGAALTLTGYAGTEIGAILTGKDTHVSNADMVSNGLNQVGINPDAVRKFQAKDVKGALADYVLPSTSPVELAGSAWRLTTGRNVDKGKEGHTEKVKDELSMLRAIPGVGPILADRSPEGVRRERMREVQKRKQEAKNSR